MNVTELYSNTLLLLLSPMQNNTNTILLYNTIQRNTTQYKPSKAPDLDITPPTLEQHGGWKALEEKKSPRGSGNRETERTLAS